MTKEPGSIGVLIPTRNCAGLLPGHVETVRGWVDLAAEVVVVDSESTDGTVEYLRANLRHPAIRFLSHPRGLYQSWNFGIRSLNTEYVYIATVGDSMTREGLQHLRGVADQFQCDVVVSKPKFVDAEGQPHPSARWPIDDIISTLGQTAPFAIERNLLFLFALAHCTEAILGSSASNLYRRECLCRNPFSADFGTVGDGAWGIANAPSIRYGATPLVCSTFRHHPKAYAASEYAVNDLPGKLYSLARETYLRMVVEDPASAEEARQLGFNELLEEIGRCLSCQRRLQMYRQSRWPWSLNPLAWCCRFERARYDREIEGLKASIVASLQKNIIA
jgi:hypothetical protein